MIQEIAKENDRVSIESSNGRKDRMGEWLGLSNGNCLAGEERWKKWEKVRQEKYV